LNNRQRMRASNKLARLELLSSGYDEIWFKPHSKRNDLVFTQRGKYLATDLWNLFDGICWFNDRIVFFQVKTNAWANMKPIKDFVKRHPINVLVINVTNKLKDCNGKYKVKIREIEN